MVGGDLLHSKKAGDGYVDTASKLDKIAAGIEAALAVAPSMAAPADQKSAPCKLS